MKFFRKATVSRYSRYNAEKFPARISVRLQRCLNITTIFLCALFLTSCSGGETSRPQSVIISSNEGSFSTVTSSESSVGTQGGYSSVVESSVIVGSSEPPELNSSETETSSADTSQTLETSETSGPVAEPNLPCKASAFYCVDDKALLSSVNANEPVAPASLTKLLTAAVALYYVSPDEVFTVGSEQELVQPGSSISFIAKGHMLTLYDLITAMLLPSGNDAAYTVAVSTARAVEPDIEMTDREAADRFCEMMNSFAARLGMTRSHFVNPDGWDDEEHYTTASDLVMLAEYALSIPQIREIAAISEKYVVFESGENVTWKNSNKLIDPNSEYYCANAVGLKTGTTPNAGCSLAAVFEKDGKKYISVVSGCETDGERYETALNDFSMYT